MSTPTISVIVPAYNAEKTILETVDSVLGQTFTDFELIVINDGSIDRTQALLESVRDPRLKLFNYSNGGLAIARNRGIEQSIGQYLSFIDADDQWTSRKLELQLKALQQNRKAGVAYSWTSCMDEQGKTLYGVETAAYCGNVQRDLLLKNFTICGSNILIKRSVVERIGGFDPSIKSCEDWDFLLRIAPHFEFVVVSKPQILYRLSSHSMSGKVEVMEQNHLLVLERAFQAAPQNLQHLKQRAIAELYQYTAQLAFSRNENGMQVGLARQKLQRSLRAYPAIVFQRRTQVLLVKLFLFQLLPSAIATALMKSIRQSHTASPQPISLIE